jgi:hypothetical protein
MKRAIMLILATLVLCSCNKGLDAKAPDTPPSQPAMENTMPPTGEEGSKSPEELGGDGTAPVPELSGDGGPGDAG